MVLLRVVVQVNLSACLPKQNTQSDSQKVMGFWSPKFQDSTSSLHLPFVYLPKRPKKKIIQREPNWEDWQVEDITHLSGDSCSALSLYDEIRLLLSPESRHWRVNRARNEFTLSSTSSSLTLESIKTELSLIQPNKGIFCAYPFDWSICLNSRHFMSILCLGMTPSFGLGLDEEGLWRAVCPWYGPRFSTIIPKEWVHLIIQQSNFQEMFFSYLLSDIWWFWDVSIPADNRHYYFHSISDPGVK